MKRHTAAELSARIGDRLAIEELNAWFCHCLDSQQYDGLADVLAVDVHYTSGAHTLHGCDAVIAHFKQRAQQTVARVTRHMHGGLRLNFDGARSAQGHSVVMNHAAFGEPPLDQIHPFQAADFSDVYRLEDDGLWRISKRVITPVMRDPTLAPRLREGVRQ
jgi:hypothetical protein